MKQNKEILKQFFETGDKPTQQQYADLIDSYVDAKQSAGEANRRFVIDETGEVSVASEVKLPEYTLSEIIGNKLSLLKDGVVVKEIDLTTYLDDTNLSRLVSGTVDPAGMATFKRDDNSTFTVDFSSLLGGSGTQVQADWSQTDNTQVNFIKNKPEIQPTRVYSSPDFLNFTNGVWKRIAFKAGYMPIDIKVTVFGTPYFDNATDVICDTFIVRGHYESKGTAEKLVVLKEASSTDSNLNVDLKAEFGTSGRMLLSLKVNGKDKKMTFLIHDFGHVYPLGNSGATTEGKWYLENDSYPTGFVNYVKQEHVSINTLLSSVSKENVIPDYQAGNSVTIDKTDPTKPVISATGGVGETRLTKEVLWTMSDFDTFNGGNMEKTHNLNMRYVVKAEWLKADRGQGGGTNARVDIYTETMNNAGYATFGHLDFAAYIMDFGPNDAIYIEYIEGTDLGGGAGNPV